MKHYPIMVAGEKATACVKIHWNTATVSVKFSHRKGQEVKFGLSEESSNVISVWEEHYDTYSAVRFEIKTAGFYGPREAISYCTSLIKSVQRYVNFSSNPDLVTKELYIILG